MIPAAYHSAKSHPGGIDDGEVHILPWIRLTQVIDGSDLDDRSENGLRVISRGTAILLLFVYVAYLIFQLKTHRHLYLSGAEAQYEAEEEARREGRPLPPRPADFEEDGTEAEMNRVAAGVGLVAATVVTSFCADYLVASIEETAQRYEIPRAFIGLIMLPIVANAAEHFTSVWMAMKNKMELTIGICVGSSIVRWVFSPLVLSSQLTNDILLGFKQQIAAFVIPLLVIVGWATHHDLTLFFADFETIVLFVSVLLVNFLIQDGRSNYLEGLMLITLYLVVALACELISVVWVFWGWGADALGSLGIIIPHRRVKSNTTAAA